MTHETLPGERSGRSPPDDLVQDLAARGIPPGSYGFQPLDAVRRTIARRMTESFRDVPHFSLQGKIEVDALTARRQALNAGVPEGRISLNDLIVKGAALALETVPAANVSYTPKGLVLHRAADIAVAVAIEGGLVTPIVRSAQSKSLQEIAAEIRDLAERGRAKRLSPEEYVGGTFSVSNLGMFGVASFTSVLNPPQGCILSVGEAEKQFRFRGDDPYIATVLAVTLTCDHRALDGATGARWLQAFRRLMEAPEGWT